MNSICLHNAMVLSFPEAIPHGAVLIENGTIAEVFSEWRFKQTIFKPGVKMIDVQGAYAAPGFIDTHIHGFGGFGADDAVYPEYSALKGRFSPAEDAAASIIQMSRLLVKYGVTAFNPTVYPAPREILIDAVAKVTDAMGREDGASIMGLHIEGPFLSPEKLGVQRPETISEVDIDYMERLWEASSGHIVNMTAAPEIRNMRSLALCCGKKGIVLQAGHTNARFEDMVEGMQVGILHATHMFNAMSKLDQRSPNAVGAILTHPEVSCEIIADGFHVHPNLFKLLAQNKPMDKIVLVSDCLKPADQAEGPYYANGEEMVLSGGLFRRKPDDVIAGTNINLMKSVQNLVKFGFTLEDAVKAASTNPAAVMGYAKKGRIFPGMDADIAVFDKDFSVRATIVGGEIKYDNL